MPRRASLPGADLLFGGPAATKPRPSNGGPAGDGTSSASQNASPRQVPLAPGPDAVAPPAFSDTVTGSVEPASRPEPPTPAPAPESRQATSRRKQPPRPRHDEKITFYCTDADVTRLEATRLALRAKHRLSTDRGRIVRAALAEILDDFDARGADSALVERLLSE